MGEEEVWNRAFEHYYFGVGIAFEFCNEFGEFGDRVGIDEVYGGIAEVARQNPGAGTLISICLRILVASPCCCAGTSSQLIEESY
ncbi:hypothetical protein [Rhizobium grahamii]|uniref:hypothetical protein n=1 Tax=Rhizobium grahamii TaxID=1120045 RepID=UPI001FCC7FD5|nr:hypothetical protein [Rhizobium grahamii]